MNKPMQWPRLALVSAALGCVGGCHTPAPPCIGCLDVPDVAIADDAADAQNDAADIGIQGDAGPQDLQRDIVLTTLSFDVTAHTGHARIQLAASPTPGVAFEAGGLQITAAHDDATGAAVTVMMDASLIHLAVPAAANTVDIDFSYQEHSPADFMGANAGYTLLWPYYCGNLYPCHSDPAHGSQYALSLTGVPSGMIAVYPPQIIANAPAYQLAWAVGDYASISLGTTTAGTHLTVHHFPADATRAQTGSAHLVAAFDWYEQTLGPYPFGSEAGSVEVAWPPGAYGGMEHHPLWHIGEAAIDDELTHMHEAAHGWFGDGIRIACWEDFVLSEGTVNYLASRAMGAVEGSAAEAAVWTRYNATPGGFALPAWPDSCHSVDVIRDHLFSSAPYIRGANFYRALENRIGRTMIDGVLRQFVTDHRGGAARLIDLLALVQRMSGYDPTDCAVAWLRPSSASMRGPATCL